MKKHDLGVRGVAVSVFYRDGMLGVPGGRNT